jgi:hypothetical protein
MGRNIASIVFFCAFALILPSSLAAQPAAEDKGNKDQQPQISQSQRELGAIILQDFSITEGKLKFRTATGGCTDKSSFTIHVKKEKGLSEKVPHYVLDIERIKIDECKAFFPEGTVIEYDLEKDLALKGDYTVSLTNLIYPFAKESY